MINQNDTLHTNLQIAAIPEDVPAPTPVPPVSEGDPSRRRSGFGSMWRNKKMMAIAAVIAVFGIGSILTVFRLLTLRSLDDRGQAAVSGGIAVVSMTQSTPASTDNTTTVNTPTVMDFTVNTNSLQVDAIQLIFTMETQSVATPPVVEPVAGTGLKIEYLDVKSQTTGYKISIILVPETIGFPYSSTSPVAFAQLKFTPNSPGSISYVFDNGLSKIPAHKSSPVKDELRDVITVLATVVDPSQVTPTPSPDPTESPTPTPEGSSPSPSPVGSATPTPTATPTSTPTPTPLSSCNGACVNHNNCIAGLACIGGVCRNPSCSGQTNCICSNSTPTPTFTPTPTPTFTPRPTNTPVSNPTPRDNVIGRPVQPITEPAGGGTTVQENDIFSAGFVTVDPITGEETVSGEETMITSQEESGADSATTSTTPTENLNLIQRIVRFIRRVLGVQP